MKEDSIKNTHFPSICVDNFFSNPDEVRELALKQTYKKAEDGRWPGTRTDSLHLIEPEFFDAFCKKFFSIFFNLEEEIKWEVKANFQIVEPFTNEKNSLKNKGWVHTDDNSLISGVIYLTPGANPNSGTSLYQQIEKEIPSNVRDVLTKFYLNNIDINYNETIKKNNSSFIKTTTFKNIFNRLIAFEGSTPHGVDTFFAEELPRLTLVFFVLMYEGPLTPIQKASSYL